MKERLNPNLEVLREDHGGEGDQAGGGSGGGGGEEVLQPPEREGGKRPDPTWCPTPSLKEPEVWLLTVPVGGSRTSDEPAADAAAALPARRLEGCPKTVAPPSSTRLPLPLPPWW
mmetsp:Transcript_59165/g.125422  ORF Transcript_59165/g.125422 Transcript_59165/m.125422 type:complete len:115 (-) Transcript_59165:303-647(-)